MDAWDQFKDAPAASADPWAQFKDATQPQPSAPESTGSQVTRGLLAAPDILATGALNIPYSILSSAYNLGRRVTGDDPNAPEPSWLAGLQAHLSPGTQKTLAETAGLPGVKQAIQGVRTAGESADRAVGAVSPTAQDVLHQTQDVAQNVATLGTGMQAAASIGQGVRQALTRTPSTIPTRAELAQRANQAYAQADNAGVVVRPQSLDNLRNTVSADLQRQGLDPTLHPDTTAALARVMDTQGGQPLQQIETLRRIALDASGAQRPADRRLAGRLVDAIDHYMEGLGPQDVSAGDPAAAVGALNQARDAWSRMRKSDVVDELMRRAELSAPNFSGSGMENAVRTEFRALAKNQARMRVFSPAEQEAITRVARGGPIENTLRMLGKFAPTGSLSTTLSAGSGFALGGPAGAIALPAAGFAARRGATAMTLGNAQRAGELMRGGVANQLAFNPGAFNLGPNALRAMELDLLNSSRQPEPMLLPRNAMLQGSQ